MRHAAFGLTLFLLAGLLSAVPASASPASASPPLSASQVVKRFAAASGGRKPAVDRAMSRPGRFTALRLSPSVSNVALYGDFVLWVVSPAVLDEAVADRLADTRTGVVGTPGASSIYWEEGTSLSGQPYFLAKKRYGANLVLWRYGPVRKVDASFTRLHKLLTKLASGQPIRTASG